MKYYLIMFCYFVFHILICFCFGKRITNRFSDVFHNYALPIGIASFICIYEILCIPIQLFHLKADFLTYLLILEYIIVFFLSLREIKHFRIKELLNRKAALFFILFFVFACFKIIDLNVFENEMCMGDHMYYVNLINANTKANTLVGNYCFNSLYQSVPNVHAFYGVMALVSAIANITNISGTIVLNSFFEWLYIAFYLSNIFGIIEINKKHRIIELNSKILFVILLISVIPNILIYSVVADFTISLFVVFFLLAYCKTKKNDFLYLYTINSFLAITTRSSYLFLLAILDMTFFVCKCLNKDLNVKEEKIVLLPIVIFSILFILYDDISVVKILLSIVLLFVYIIVDKIAHVLGQRITNIIVYCFAAILFVYFVVCSIPLGDLPTTWNGITVYNLLNSYFFNFSSIENSLYCLLNCAYLLSAILLLTKQLIKRRYIDYEQLHIVLTFVLFLNWLVGPAIARYFLTEVYDRVIWIWYTSITALFLYSNLLRDESFIYKKILSNVLLILLIANCCVNVITAINKEKECIDNFKTNKDQYSIAYRVGKNSYNIGIAIDNYADERNIEDVYVSFPTTITNVSFVSRRMKLSNIMGGLTSVVNYRTRDYYTMKWNEDSYEYALYFYLQQPYRYFNDWYFENDRKKIPNLKEMLLSSNTDIFVVAKWEGNEDTCYHFNDYLLEFSTLIYENEEYRVYSINRQA